MDHFSYVRSPALFLLLGTLESREHVVPVSSASVAPLEAIFVFSLSGRAERDEEAGIPEPARTSRVDEFSGR